MALGLTLLFAQPNEAAAQYRGPKTVQTFVGDPKKETDKSETGTGSLHGTVSDKNNRPAKGIYVDLFRGNTYERSATTDSAGNYHFKHLAPAQYHLAISGSDHKFREVTEINVLAGQSTERNIVVEQEFGSRRLEPMVTGDPYFEEPKPKKRKK